MKSSLEGGEENRKKKKSTHTADSPTQLPLTQGGHLTDHLTACLSPPPPRHPCPPAPAPLATTIICSSPAYKQTSVALKFNFLNGNKPWPERDQQQQPHRQTKLNGFHRIKKLKTKHLLEHIILTPLSQNPPLLQSLKILQLQHLKYLCPSTQRMLRIFMKRS